MASPPPRPPRDYRVDLRPMILLGLLLLVIVVGWILLSPIVLPSPAQ
jgi:hypothetical protein